jgi:hypothetical protein
VLHPAHQPAQIVRGDVRPDDALGPGPAEHGRQGREQIATQLGGLRALRARAAQHRGQARIGEQDPQAGPQQTGQPGRDVRVRGGRLRVRHQRVEALRGQ